jgi:DNA-directed RNA polymerase subunit RPC12/RpoP
MSILQKTEDIFKPAGKEELTGRKAEMDRLRSEKNKKLLANLEKAVCPHCKSPIKTNLTEVWSGYATVSQDYEWDENTMNWEPAGESEDDYGDGEAEYRCTECDTRLDLGEMGVPELGGLEGEYNT